jgi:TP901 family phage tail tape measure protein
MADSKRNPKVELTLDKDRFDRGLDASGRKLRRFARDASKSLGDLDRSTASMLGGALRKVGGPLLTKGLDLSKMIGAGAGVAGALGFDAAQGFEKSLVRYQIATDSTDDSIANMRESLTQLSRESGLNRAELLSGASAYVALTGDADGARASIATFAKVANATGASLADVAATGAALRDNLGIDPKDFEAGFSALHVQGKAGAVELRELATELAGVAPSFAAFKNGTGTDGLIEMGAALQVVRKGFGSTSEAATGLRSMMVAVQRNADKFKKAGVRVFDRDPKTGRKSLRDFSDIVDAIGASKLAKDPTLLTKAFGSDEAKRAYDQLNRNRGLLDELIAKSTDKNAIDRDAQKYMSNPAAKVARLWNDVKLRIAEVFTPDRIAAFAGALEHVVGITASIIGNLEQIAARMGGTDTYLVDKRMAGRLASTVASSTGRMPEVSASSFKLASTDSGANSTGFFSEPAEAAGRFLSGDQLTHRVGAMAQFASSFARAQSGEAGASQRSQLTGRGPMAAPPIVQVPVTVQVDGVAIAKATANSPVHRLTPGGR